MQQINYDIFWNLTFFLDIKSIQNLSNTCKQLNFYKKESEPVLLKRMFPTFPVRMNEPWILLYKFYLWHYFQQSTFIERIVIFTVNETNKLKRLKLQPQQPQQHPQQQQKEKEFEGYQFERYLFNLFVKIINNDKEMLNLSNMNYIFIHGCRVYKKLLIEKIFDSRVVICNFNLQHLFNAILVLQDINYLSRFHLHFKEAHIMITKNHIKRIIMSKNIIFFDALVEMFIGDLIKLNLYQSSIKECNIAPFTKYIQ